MSCLRTGMCCQRIPLRASPRELRESYEAWLRHHDRERIEFLRRVQAQDSPRLKFYSEIHLVYPMLKDRCLGKIRLPELEPKKEKLALVNEAGYSYIYGPCRFFERFEIIDGRLIGGCAINDIKPWMCSSYPNGGWGTFRGCGYNRSRPEIGLTFDDFAKLEPLTEQEK